MMPRALTRVGVALWAVYVAVVLLGLHGGALDWMYQVVPIVVPAVSAIVCIDAARRSSGRARTVWLLFGIGAAFWAAGDTVYTILDVAGIRPDAALTPADAGYLLLIPLWAAAIILHPTRRARGLGLVGSAIDASTVVVAASAVTAAFVLAPILRTAEDAAGAIVTLSYPLGDLALLAGGVTLVVRAGGGARRGEALIAGAVAIFALGDIVYARLALTGAYEAGSPVDLTWQVGFLALAVASRREIAAEGRPAARAVTWMSVLGLAAVGGLVAVSLLTDERAILLGGAAVAGLLLATRQTLLLVENRRLIGALAQGVEDLEAAAKAEERFIAAVSHDLRAPLTAIGGFARMLRNPDTSRSAERVVQYSETIGRNAERLHWLVEDLLFAGEYAAGVGPAVLTEPVDLLELAMRTASDLGVEDKVSVTGVPTTALADARRLQQVLTNLYDNGIKHTSPGTEVSVEVGSSSGVPHVVVSDDGPGIDQGRMDEIFRPFVWFGSHVASVGLGLFIVRTLVEAMNGTVKCTSEAGHGATFTVTLPPHPTGVPPDRGG